MTRYALNRAGVIDVLTTRYALCSDVTPYRGTVRMLADTADELRLTSEDLAAAGLGDTAQIVEVPADSQIGERIYR
jgi:hypothetical protein